MPVFVDAQAKKTHCEWHLHHKHKCCTIQKMKRQCCDAPAMCEMVLNEMKAKTPLVFVDGFCTMTTSTITCKHHQHTISCIHLTVPVHKGWVHVQHRNPTTVYNHNHQHSFHPSFNHHKTHICLDPIYHSCLPTSLQRLCSFHVHWQRHTQLEAF